MNGQPKSLSLEAIAPGGFLGVALVASVWQLWTLHILVVAGALFLLVLANERPSRPSLAFLSIAAIILPVSSLAQGQELDHFYGLAVYLLLGWVGLLLGFQSASRSIFLGFTFFLLVLIVVTLFVFLMDPVGSLNQTNYHQGALTGPFGHRNTMGAFLALGLVALLLSRTNRRTTEVARWGLVGLVGALLVLTESLAPVVALVCGLCLANSIPGVLLPEKNPMPRRVRATWVFSALVGVVIAVVVTPFWRPSLGARFDIWSLAIEKLVDRFPLPPGVEWLSSPEILDTLGFYPWHSHNALIQLFLIYGVLPTLIFVVAIVGAVLVSPPFVATRAWVGADEALVATALLGFMAAHGLVETTFISGPVGILLLGLILGLLLSRKVLGQDSSGHSRNQRTIIAPGRAGGPPLWRRKESNGPV